MGEMHDRMRSGRLYRAGGDGEIAAGWRRCAQLMDRFDAAGNDRDARMAVLREMLGHVGEDVSVRPGFRCEYGTPISIGRGTFINFDCVMLDVREITIGEDCQVATRVQFLTATHPIDPGPRRIGWQSAEPIVVEDNVWLGGGAIVNPGVTIGRDTIVGSGSVVTRDLPAGVVAAGVPARVMREIGPDDAVEVPS